MEIYDVFETVKQKLIIAGIAEIEEHGISDFSLRRVASACNVSCAAPYKHFKSKENFIDEIVIYIYNKWLMLQNQVASIFEGDLKKQLSEICVASVKFWIANPNFRTILTLKPDNFSDETMSVISKITDITKELIHALCVEYKIDQEEEKRKSYVIRSLMYGATFLIDSGELENSVETINMIRQCVEDEF